MDGDTAGGADGRLRPPRGASGGRPIRARTPTETRTPRVPPAHVQRRAADSADGRLRPPRGASGGRPIRARTPTETRTPRVPPAHVQRRAADSAAGRLRPPRGASARLSDKDANTYGHTDAAYAPGARATTRGGWRGRAFSSTAKAAGNADRQKNARTHGKANTAGIARRKQNARGRMMKRTRRADHSKNEMPADARKNDEEDASWRSKSRQI